MNLEEKEMKDISNKKSNDDPPPLDSINIERPNANEQKLARTRVYKNLLITGFSWIFLFTAYGGLALLQSSLNSDGGLGTASLSTIYVALIVSCLFLPTTLIEKLGIKYTIVFSQIAYILYILANIYPKYYTLIPTAIILGFGAAPLWTAKCAFLTDLGTYYSKYTGETPEVVINRFFGIFFAMFQSNNIWGNIISSTVLKPEVDSKSTFEQNVSLCGVNDYPGSEGVKIKQPQKSTVYILCGIYVGCAIFAIFLVLIFLDKYQKIGMENTKPKKSSKHLLINTIKHIIKKNQLLIIPLTLWSGFEQAFIGADFTKSFVSCTQGVQYVGFVMIAFGVADVLGSYGFGYVIKYVGRIPCFIVAALFNYVSIGVMLFWKPNSESMFILYLIAVLWGLGDAVWQTQINAFYGVLFESHEEAAFSNYRLWESLGFAIAYAYSNFLGVRIKLILLVIYLSLGIIGYGLIEIFLRTKKKVQITPF